MVNNSGKYIYVPMVPFFQSHMFPEPYVPKRSEVPNVLFPGSLVPKVLRV